MEQTTVIANPVDLSSADTIPARADARRGLRIPVNDGPLVSIVGDANSDIEAGQRVESVTWQVSAHDDLREAIADIIEQKCLIVPTSGVTSC
jgi:hypothetical protein